MTDGTLVPKRMGDLRYERHYREVAEATDRVAAIRGLSNEAVVMALAAASREKDPLLANVLATEALNRMRRAGVIAEHLGEGVLAVDEENRVTFANPAASEVLGYDRDELVGTRLHELVHVREDGAPMPEEACMVVETLRTGRTLHRRDHGDAFRCKDGTLLPIELTSAPVTRGDEIVGAVVVFGDLTRERETEAALERLAAIVSTSEDAIVAETADGVVTAWNLGAERLFGYRAEEILGKPSRVLVPPARAHELDALRRVSEGGRSDRLDTERLRKDGSRVHVSVTLSPLRAPSGRSAGLSAIYRDVSARKRVEAERDRAEAELARAFAREREMHATVRYRLATLLPAIAWGLGSVILFRTLLLGWFAASPENWDDGLVLATTTLALAMGALVGSGVYAWKRARARREP